MSIEVYKVGLVNDSISIPLEIVDKRTWHDNDTHCITVNCEYFIENIPYDVYILQENERIISIIEAYAVKNGKVMFKIDKKDEKLFQTGRSKTKKFKVEVFETKNKQVKYESYYFYRRKTLVKNANKTEPSKTIASISSSEEDESMKMKSLILPNKNNSSSSKTHFSSLQSEKNNSAISTKKCFISDDDSSDLNHAMEFENYSGKNSIVKNYEKPHEANFCAKKTSNINNEDSVDLYSLNLAKDSLKINDFKLFKEYSKDIDSFSIIINKNYAPENAEKLDEHIYFVKSESKSATNHAIRLLRDKYNVGYIASIKILDERINRLRSENSVLQFNPKQSLFKLLQQGIRTKVIPHELVYIGHSNSGLKENNIWAIDKQSLDKIGFHTLLNDIGDFSSIQKPEKLCKRYAQTFSTSLPSIKLNANQYICIEDDKTNDEMYEFTDGVGMMRIKAAEEISRSLELEYTSFIFQIRCGCFKGVLVAFEDEIFDKCLNKQNLEKGTRKSAIKVIFRKSQKKFEVKEKEIMLNIVSWVNTVESLPTASLNSEFIMILDGLDKNGSLGIRDYIVSLFKNSLQDIIESTDDPMKAYSKLFFGSDISEFSIKYSSLLLACEGKLSETLDANTHKIIKNQILKQHLVPTICERKYNISVENSFYLMGIIDETGTLKEDEVFVSYRDSNGGIQYLDNVNVVVSKTPCYCLSEMRVVKTKNVPQMNHLVNCIAFSKNGNRPLPNCLSGGDLDGDQYFVSFNQILCRFQNEAPIEYPKDSSKPKTMVKNGNMRDIIIETVLDAILGKKNAGIWHYYLTCLYDQDRSKMSEKCYIEGAIEFNKFIDGIECREAPRTQKPHWYIKKDESQDFEALNNLIKEKKLYNTDNTNRMSLIQYLVRLACKSFSELSEIKINNTASMFFTEEDEKILVLNNKIDLDIVRNELADMNGYLGYEELKKQYLASIKDKNRQSTNKKLDSYAGNVEKMMNAAKNSKLKNDNVMRKEIFRKFVVNYPYEISLQKQMLPIMEKAIYNENGLFYQSRVYNIYKNIMNYNRNDGYYIVWEFYDTLCSLKNYCRYKKNTQISNEFYSSMPYTIPFEFSKAFSIAKLEKLS